jgi:hypothetical protein
MKLIKIAAVAIVVAFPISANAVVLGQLDLVGNVNPSNSVYSSTGQVDFVGDATATIASGVFDSVTTIEEAQGNPLEPTVFSMSDIDFGNTLPQQIFSGGGFSFTATGFSDFDNMFPGRAFDAQGFATGPFGNLPGVFSFSSQARGPGETLASFSSTTTVIPVPASILMLISAIGGFGFLSYRRRSAAA